MAVPGRSVVGAAFPAAGQLDRIKQMQRELTRAAAEGGMVARPTSAAPAPPTPSYGVVLDPDPVEIPADVPAPAPALAPAPEGMPQRPPLQVGPGRFADAEGRPAVRRDNQTFAYEDGTVVDVEGNVVGVVTPGDLTDTSAAPADNLEASAVEIEDGEPKKRSGLTPNTKKIDPLEKLAGDIFQATTEAPGESLSQGTVRRLYRQFSKLSPEEQAMVSEIMPALTIPDPDTGKTRLSRLAEIAGEDPQFRAAQQIDNAAQAVEASQAPGRRTADPALAAENVAVARSLIEEQLPEGDWNALSRVFGELPPEQRTAVLQRLSGLRSDDPASARGFVSQMLDGNSAEPVFVPNQMALTLAPMNKVDEMLMDIDAAKRVGDSDRQAALSEQLRQGIAGGQFTSEQVNDARSRFLLRRQVEQELRRAIIGTDDTYGTAQARLLEAGRPVPQAPTIPQGARTPEVSTVGVDEPAAPEGAAATAALREREQQAEARAPGKFLSRAQRIALTGLDPDDKQAARRLPLWLKGSSSKPNTPFEGRTAGERGLSTRDEEAVKQAIELYGPNRATDPDSPKGAMEEAQDELRRAQYELRLAQMGRTSRNARTSLEDVAAAQEKLASIQNTIRNLAAMEDDLFPPRVINNRTGALVINPSTGQPVRVPKDWLRNPDAVPEQYSIERGYRGLSDSQLNRGGQRETYNQLLATIAGFRPKAADNVGRANAAMNPLDAAAIRDEAIEMFGDDAAELLDEDFRPNWAADPDDLRQPGAPLRDGRLGGNPQDSRVRSAVLSLFNGPNPLTLINPATSRRFTAEEVVDEAMNKGDIFGPDPTSDAYKAARERIIRQVEREFIDNARSAPPMRLVEKPDGTVEIELATNDAPAPAPDPAAAGVATAQDPNAIPREGVRDMRGLERGVPNQLGQVEQLTPEERLAQYERRLEEFQRAVRQPGYTRTAPSEVLEPRGGAPVEVDASGMPVAVKPGTPRATRDFSAPETVLSPEDEALLASNMPIEDPDVIDAPDRTPASKPATSGGSQAEVIDAADDAPETYTTQQLEALWRAWFARQKPRVFSTDKGSFWQMGIRPGMTFEEFARETLDGKGLRNYAPAEYGEGGQVVRQQRKVKVIGVDGGEVIDAADDAAAATPAPDATAPRPLGADDADAIDAPDDPPAAATQAADDVAETADPADTSTAGDAARQADAQTRGADVRPQDKWRFPWGRVGLGAAALLGGATVVSNLSQPDLTNPIDIPGGGGPGDGGGVPYIPVGSQSGALAPASAVSPEDAIERALERIRGARATRGAPSYNTMFNYTYRS